MATDQLYYEQPKTQTAAITFKWIERRVGQLVAKWPIDCYPVLLFDQNNNQVWLSSPKEVIQQTK